jgi:hypothetical protein
LPRAGQSDWHGELHIMFPNLDALGQAL